MLFLDFCPAKLMDRLIMLMKARESVEKRVCVVASRFVGSLVVVELSKRADISFVVSGPATKN